MNIGASVFGFRFEDYFSLDAVSNPDVGGYLGDVRCGTSAPYLQYKNGRLSLVRTNQILFAQTFRARNRLKPYCISAGGNEYAYSFGINTDFPALGIWADLGLVGASVRMDEGLLAINTRAGIPWLLDTYAGIYLQTDGLGFGFVPVQSAFDFKRGVDALDTDYTAILKTELFENTPFDVVIGRLPIYLIDGQVFENYNHEEIYNPSIRKSSNTMDRYITTDSTSRLLAREIGDEELYLDNAILQHDASYSAALSVYVRRSQSPAFCNNPYYEYDNGIINESIIIPGAYARSGEWQLARDDIQPAFYALNGVYVDDIDFHFDMLDRNFPCAAAGSYRYAPHKNDGTSVVDNDESLHPLNIDDICRFNIYTIDGKSVYTGTSSIGYGEIESLLSNGVYFIQTISPTGVNHINKIVITK